MLHLLFLLACRTPTPPPADEELPVLRDGCAIGILESCVDLGARQWDRNRDEGRAAYTRACELGHQVSCEVVAEEERP